MVGRTDDLDDWSDVEREVSKLPDAPVPCLDSTLMETFVCWMLGKGYYDSDAEYISALQQYGETRAEIQEKVFRHLRTCIPCSNEHEGQRMFYHNVRQSLAPKGK